mgnify:CR=1 FL=1
MLRGAPTLTPDTEALFEKALTALRFAILAQAIDAPQLLAGAYGERLGFSGGKLRTKNPMEVV